MSLKWKHSPQIQPNGAIVKSKNKDNPNILYYTPEPVDNDRLANLCGPLDENLRQIQAALDIEIARRGGNFIISGKKRGSRSPDHRGFLCRGR